MNELETAKEQASVSSVIAEIGECSVPTSNV